MYKYKGKPIIKYFLGIAHFTVLLQRGMYIIRQDNISHCVITSNNAFHCGRHRSRKQVIHCQRYHMLSSGYPLQGSSTLPPGGGGQFQPQESYATLANMLTAVLFNRFWSKLSILDYSGGSKTTPQSLARNMLDYSGRSTWQVVNHCRVVLPSTSHRQAEEGDTIATASISTLNYSRSVCRFRACCSLAPYLWSSLSFFKGGFVHPRIVTCLDTVFMVAPEDSRKAVPFQVEDPLLILLRSLIVSCEVNTPK